jgi:hypothetical protein
VFNWNDFVGQRRDDDGPIHQADDVDADDDDGRLPLLPLLLTLLTLLTLTPRCCLPRWLAALLDGSWCWSSAQREQRVPVAG